MTSHGEAELKLVDAHIHLSDEEYLNSVDKVVGEAKEAGVIAMVSNSMDLKTCVRTLELAESYSGTVYAALGIHPWTVNKLTADELEQTLELVKKQSQNKSVVAIGEIGLDSRYEGIWESQIRVFELMLRAAEELCLPVVVHSRGTTVQIIDMLPSYKLKNVLLHWFSEPIGALSKAVERGYYISEGVPTVYSKGIRDVVQQIPIGNLLTETDGPVQFFKAPFKGKKTTPAFIPTIINAIAELKKLSPDQVAEYVAKNFEDFFNVKLDV